MKNRILKSDHNELSNKDIKEIARELDVEEREVIEMDQRLSGSDQSLNAIMGDEDGTEWIDMLADDRTNQEINLGENQQYSERKALFTKAMGNLSEREQEIIQRRMLEEVPATLEDLSQQYGVSRERIRQIEARALEKLTAEVQQANS